MRGQNELDKRFGIRIGRWCQRAATGVKNWSSELDTSVAKPETINRYFGKGCACGEGDRRENGRKAEYVGLVGLHLFLTPLCRFEIFLIKISKQYTCDKIRTQQ